MCICALIQNKAKGNNRDKIECLDDQTQLKTNNMNNIGNFNDLNFIDQNLLRDNLISLKNALNSQSNFKSIAANENNSTVINNFATNSNSLSNNNFSSGLNQMNNFISSHLLNNYALNSYLTSYSLEGLNPLILGENINNANNSYSGNNSQNNLVNFINPSTNNPKEINYKISEKNLNEANIKKSPELSTELVNIDTDTLQKMINERIKKEKDLILADKPFSELIEYLTSKDWEELRMESLSNEKKLQENKMLLNTKEIENHKFFDFKFGNYERFYYNKFLEGFNEERLKYFDEGWIKNKKCLDIGCNNGILTILISINFQPRSIEGIDIDPKLIKKAIKCYKHVLRNNFNKDLIDKLLIINKKIEKKNNVIEEIFSKNEYNKEKENELALNVSKFSIFIFYLIYYAFPILLLIKLYKYLHFLNCIYTKFITYQ